MFGEFDPEGSVDDDAKTQLFIVAAIVAGIVVVVGGCVFCGGLLFLLDRVVV